MSNTVTSKQYRIYFNCKNNFFYGQNYNFVKNWVFKVKPQTQDVNTVIIFDQSTSQKNVNSMCINRCILIKIVAVFANNIQCVMCIFFTLFAVARVREKIPNHDFDIHIKSLIPKQNHSRYTYTEILLVLLKLI